PIAAGQRPWLIPRNYNFLSFWEPWHLQVIYWLPTCPMATALMMRSIWQENQENSMSLQRISTGRINTIFGVALSAAFSLPCLILEPTKAKLGDTLRQKIREIPGLACC